MSKMAAKLKKRLSKIENKLLKLEKLELKDVICSICQSVLIEPVTLPCYHDFCQRCFNGSIENNALCCPLCRLRIGSWLRTATKQKNVVNIQLWNVIKNRFPKEVDKKLNGEDVDVPSAIPLIRLSQPGEIRSEYEAELKRLQAERLQLEQKQFHETEVLIKKLQDEEEQAYKRYLERLKQDEILAKQLQQENEIGVVSSKVPKNNVIKFPSAQHRLKPTTIDSYLSKSTLQAIITKHSPIMTEDNTSTDVTTPIKSNSSNSSRLSPEMLPNYGKILKNIVDRKTRNRPSTWNKENGDTTPKDKKGPEISNLDLSRNDDKCKTKTEGQSLLVSLPLPHAGILQKTSFPDHNNIETSSVDSMHQELCYFKPIEGTTPTSFNTNKDLPLRIPCIRVDNEQMKISMSESHPSREQYLEGLCRLRDLSLTHKLPSAFVIALSLLKTKKANSKKSTANTRSRAKKSSATNSIIVTPMSSKRSVGRNKHIEMVDGITNLNKKTTLRRTRSMGSIHKNENEITPKKKVKERKFYSDKKPYLRSDSKRMHLKIESYSPSSCTETINNNKVNLAVKNLSSPLENCDVKNILREQLRIEKIIEQEKSDFELACKVDAEWNGRRAATKRQVSLTHALRPAKKLKV